MRYFPDLELDFLLENLFKSLTSVHAKARLFRDSLFYRVIKEQELDYDALKNMFILD